MSEGWFASLENFLILELINAELMETKTMASVVQRLPYDEVEPKWREGLPYSPTIKITVENEPEKPDFHEALKAASGIWADRGDVDEIFAREREKRALRQAKLFKDLEE